MNHGKPSIYISHAWGGESEQLVHKIMHKFAKEGIEITLDKKDLGYRQSINAFMERLGEADAIIIVVSNKYLHSEYCMFELLQIYENKNILERIFPVVLDEVNIAKSTNRLDLVKYWESQTKELENKIRDLDSLSYIEGITDDLNLYQNIRAKIAKLTSILKDINTLNIQLHTESDFNDLFLAVKRRLDSHVQPMPVEESVSSPPPAPPSAGAAPQTVSTPPVYTPPPASPKKRKTWLWVLLPVVAVAAWFIWTSISGNAKDKDADLSVNQSDTTSLEMVMEEPAVAGGEPGNASGAQKPRKPESTDNQIPKSQESDQQKPSGEALLNTRPPAGTTFQQMKLILDRSVRNA
ncbi:MAG: toll/interleukin-1 receptor domain-containing protein, partial [Saprospiraceae bacterium]|nr:toll/interleukin-1 receptor domain-containing protein [Saprospiraceae bacterium]